MVVTHYQAKAAPEEKAGSGLVRTPACGVFGTKPHAGVRTKPLGKRLI